MAPQTKGKTLRMFFVCVVVVTNMKVMGSTWFLLESDLEQYLSLQRRSDTHLNEGPLSLLV